MEVVAASKCIVYPRRKRHQLRMHRQCQRHLLLGNLPGQAASNCQICVTELRYPGGKNRSDPIGPADITAVGPNVIH